VSIVPGRDIPEVPQAWVGAVNEAVNDANHEDLCSSLHGLAECDSYRPGQWDIGVDLTIAVGVLDPLIRRRIAGEFTEAAESLGSAVRELDAHIERRAQEIAQPRVDQERMTSARIVAEQRTEMEGMRQRKDDLITELRRQLDAQVKMNARLLPEVKDLKATVERVRAMRCWENEDRRWFMFRDDLYAALRGEEDPT